MYHGQVPLLTKGPFAHYYGGYQIIDHLSLEDPGRGNQIAILASASLWICAFFVKRYIKMRHHTLVQLLRSIILDNVLNANFKATILGLVTCFAEGNFDAQDYMLGGRGGSPYPFNRGG